MCKAPEMHLLEKPGLILYRTSKAAHFFVTLFQWFDFIPVLFFPVIYIVIFLFELKKPWKKDQ